MASVVKWAETVQKKEQKQGGSKRLYRTVFGAWLLLNQEQMRCLFAGGFSKRKPARLQRAEPCFRPLIKMAVKDEQKRPHRTVLLTWPLSNP